MIRVWGYYRSPSAGKPFLVNQPVTTAAGLPPHHPAPFALVLKAPGRQPGRIHRGPAVWGLEDGLHPRRAVGWGLGLAPGDRLVPLLLALVLAILWSLLEFEGSESGAMGLADPKWTGVTGVRPCPSGPWPPLRLICLCLLQPSSGLDQAIGGPWPGVERSASRCPWP